MSHSRAFLAAASLCTVLWIAPAIAGSAPTYHVAHQYYVGGEGGWDYLSIDSDNRRVYVSHETHLEVLDADSGTIVGVIPDTPGVHGAAIVSNLARGFSSNGGDGTVSIFDLKTLKVIRKVQVNKPDFILYDTFSQRVFPLSEKTTVLDARSGERVGNVNLGGKPEAAVSDGKGDIYVNMIDKRVVAVVDVSTLKVTKTYPVPCAAPRSLAYDGENRRLLIGCSDGFLAVDADSGKVVGNSSICSGVDAGVFDSKATLVFESCHVGIMSVIRQVTPDVYELVQSVPTAIGAKTMAFDPQTGRIYLSTADIERSPNNAQKPNQAPRFQVKSGSFRILVLEP